MNRDEQTGQSTALVQEDPIFAIEEMESRLEMQIIWVECPADSDASCCCIIV
jgi:hypothetical protein